MPYSFTHVEDPDCQMIIAQSCERSLYQYVANGFSSQSYEEVIATGSGVGKRDKVAAEEAAEMYGTLSEYDAQYETPYAYIL